MKKNKLAYYLTGAFATLILISIVGFTQKADSTNEEAVEDDHGRYLNVQVTEVYTEHGHSEIEVAWGENKIDHLELKKYHRDNRDHNLNIITDLLNKLHNEGYDVISHSMAVTNHHKVQLYVLEHHRERKIEFK